MGRHALTLEEQIKGIRKAIASPRTPEQLRRPLRERLALLARKLDRQKKGPKRSGRNRAGLLDWLGL
jgi:hypothetical protein